MSLKFTLTPVARDSFTPELLKQLIIDGVEFVNTIPSCTSPSPSDAVRWTASKQDAEVLVWRTTYEAESWIARVTKADLPYLPVHRALVEDRAAAEKAWLDGPKDDMTEMGREELKELGIGIHGLFFLSTTFQSTTCRLQMNRFADFKDRCTKVFEHSGACWKGIPRERHLE